jgi:glycosyltransferase involved in cell wall biosynthesis
MTPHFEEDCGPLVVHVIPSPRGRGAQRAARLLVDRLNEQHTLRHCLVGLFEGPPEVELDVAIRQPAGSRPAQGFDPRLAIRLRRLLARLKPAAVVAHGGDAMKYTMPALVGTGCPVVYCVIGTYAGGAGTMHELVWRHLMNRADLVVAVGDEVRDECTGRFRVPSRKAVMIPNGRDSSVFRPRSGPGRGGEATLIFVGALTPQKQPDRYVEVVRRLRSENRTFRALLVGDGPLASALAASAASVDIELLGARADVPDLLRSADLFVFTSLPTGEGMPGVLIEAGLSGLPAVSTPVPGVASVVCDGRTGIIVDDSVATIASAVETLLDDPERRAAMGVSARNRCVSEFGLDLMAHRWAGALQSLLEDQMDPARPGVRTPPWRAGALVRAMLPRRRSSRPEAGGRRRRPRSRPYAE